MGLFLDQFFTVASQFNPLGLTDEEIGLFTAILMICPGRNSFIYLNKCSSDLKTYV